MSTLREMAEEISKRLDETADFFLVLKPKQPDNLGVKRSIVVTNVMRPLEGDTQVEGTGVLVMDNTLKTGYADGQAS